MSSTASSQDPTTHWSASAHAPPWFLPPRHVPTGGAGAPSPVDPDQDNTF
jgi:hypothetical protein